MTPILTVLLVLGIGLLAFGGVWLVSKRAQGHDEQARRGRWSGLGTTSSRKTGYRARIARLTDSDSREARRGVVVGKHRAE